MPPAATSAGESEFRIRDKDGSVRSVALTAIPATHEQLKANFWPKRNLSPAAQEDGVARWLHVLDGVALPPYLSRLDDNYWHSYPEQGTLYVQLNQMRDKGPVSVQDYLSGLLDETRERKVQNAIVDLRFIAVAMIRSPPTFRGGCQRSCRREARLSS